MKTIRVDLPLSELQIDQLVNLAIIGGWQREEPRKRWTDRERFEAARYGVNVAVARALDKLPKQ